MAVGAGLKLGAGSSARPLVDAAVEAAVNKI